MNFHGCEYAKVYIIGIFCVCAFFYVLQEAFEINVFMLLVYLK